MPYSCVDTSGKHIPKNQRAAGAARFLAENIWSDKRTLLAKRFFQNRIFTRPPIFTTPPIFDLDKSTLDEIIEIILRK